MRSFVPVRGLHSALPAQMPVRLQLARVQVQRLPRAPCFDERVSPALGAHNLYLRLLV